MKKSNKLLLGGFLAGLLLVSAIHFTLYAKYKRGDYTLYNASEELRSVPMQVFPNVLFVDIRDVPEATVKLGGAATEVEKREGDDIRYVQRGDTLLITGTKGELRGDGGYPPAVHLPYNTTLSAFNSSLSFETDNKTAAGNPVIYLQKSSASFSGLGMPSQIGHLTIVASDGSAALFRNNFQVGLLDVKLSNSFLEYGKGDVGRLSIVTDSLSRLLLPAKLLMKASITNKP